MLLKKLFRKKKIDIEFEFKTRIHELYAALRNDITVCPYCNTDDPILINKIEHHYKENKIMIVFVHVMKCRKCFIERNFSLGGIWENEL